MRFDDVAGSICLALHHGDRGEQMQLGGRGLHSFTFQLNLSRV